MSKMTKITVDNVPIKVYASGIAICQQSPRGNWQAKREDKGKWFVTNLPDVKLSDDIVKAMETAYQALSGKATRVIVEETYPE